MTKAKHTPLPWGFDGDGFDSVAAQLCDTDGYTIFPLDADGHVCGHIAEMSEVEGDEEAEANAAFIVRACNTHYELLGLLKEYAASDEPVSLYQDADYQARVRAAINKASGASS